MSGYVAVWWTPKGYRLSECEGEPPAVGERLEGEDGPQVVQKLGASPLPADARTCAFLAPEPVAEPAT